MGKCITFSVPIKKECDNGKTISYKLNFIDSFRFMSTLLSSLVNNLPDIYKKECKKCKEREKIISKCRFIAIEDNKLSYKCIKCNDKSHKSINGLDKKFPNIYKFFNNDLDKFALFLGKDIYPYEYMDSWEKFNKITLPSKEALYRNLNLEDISNENYSHAQKVWDVFKIRNLG